MDPDELRELWRAAGGRADAPSRGGGLLGLHAVDDPAALTGMALAVLGVPLGGAGDVPAAIRRASLRYADWLPALTGGFRAADYGDVAVVKDDPAVAFMQAHERLADIVAAGAAPLVLGGDALVSVPVLQVLSGKLRGRLGVIAFTPAYEVAPEPAVRGRVQMGPGARARCRLAGQPGADRRARRPRRTDPPAACSTASARRPSRSTTCCATV